MKVMPKGGNTVHLSYWIEEKLCEIGHTEEAIGRLIEILVKKDILSIDDVCNILDENCDSIELED